MEIVLGPPGTGKTTTLLGYVEQELEAKVPPEEIGFLSFTKKAADEAVTRACEKFKLDRKRFPYFRTLHSLCFQQLGMRSSEVMQGEALDKFAEFAGVRITGRFSEDGTMSGYELGDRVLFMENLARIRGVPLRTLYDQDDDGIPWVEVDRVAKALAIFKKEHGMLDFTDMLSEYVRLGRHPNLRVLIIDEAQDLSWLQWQVVNLLATGTRRHVVAGDDDQAIYRWAGAAVEHFVDLSGDSRVLGQSWRVPPAVQSVANGLIGKVRRRRVKDWAARAGVQGEVEHKGWVEAVNLDDSTDVLVLARNIYVLNPVTAWLRGRGIVYERNGHPSIRPELLQAITTWENLRAGKPAELPEVRGLYKYLAVDKDVKRGYKTLAQFPEQGVVDMRSLRLTGGLLAEPKIWHEALTRLPTNDLQYIRIAREHGEKLRKRPRVRVSTIHGSKGGEANHVVLLKEMAPRTYREMENNIDDEMRTFYVGVTRAREKLTIVESNTNLAFPYL